MCIYKEVKSFSFMKQQNAMPTACTKCGEVFDISYEFKEYTKEDILETLAKLRSLCWECRIV